MRFRAIHCSTSGLSAVHVQFLHMTKNGCPIDHVADHPSTSVIPLTFIISYPPIRTIITSLKTKPSGTSSTRHPFHFFSAAEYHYHRLARPNNGPSLKRRPSSIHNTLAIFHKHILPLFYPLSKWNKPICLRCNCLSKVSL